MFMLLRASPRLCHPFPTPQHLLSPVIGSSLPAPSLRRGASCLVIRAAPFDNNGSQSHFNNKEEAYSEAADLYMHARDLAHLQTQAELQQAFDADLTSTSGTAAAGPPASDTAMIGFWTEQGLSTSSANRLLTELKGKGKAYSMQQMSAKMQRWQRVLPNMDIAELVVRDTEMLDADINTAILNMIGLVDSFPGKDIFSILRKQPRLLWCQDLLERRPRVLNKLATLHPSKDLQVVSEVVAENPELLFRMDYYLGARMLDELPVEIQNMFVVADQGIGFLHRYYNRRSTNFGPDAIQSEAGF